MAAGPAVSSVHICLITAIAPAPTAIKFSRFPVQFRNPVPISSRLLMKSSLMRLFTSSVHVVFRMLNFAVHPPSMAFTSSSALVMLVANLPSISSYTS